MTIRKIFVGASVSALIAACSPQATETPSDVETASTETVENSSGPSGMATPPAAFREVDATASIINREGATIGSALFYQGSNGVVMRLSVNGLTPGVHGMHYHAIGTCDDPQDGFQATGGHVMPFGKPHGYMHPDGPHAGNLPNLIVPADGTATVELYTSLVSLFEGPAALLDADGSTLIIHENEDDHLTQPIGGAGGRIACGIVQRPS